VAVRIVQIDRRRRLDGRKPRNTQPRDARHDRHVLWLVIIHQRWLLDIERDSALLKIRQSTEMLGYFFV
jgi:hypothetical protein